MGLIQAARARLGLYTKAELTNAAEQAAHRAAALVSQSYPALNEVLSERAISRGRGVEPLDQNFTAYLHTIGKFPWLTPSVNLISNLGASIPLCLYDAEGDMIEEHPVLDRLMKPNPDQGFFAFWYAALQQHCYTGETFFSGVGNPDAMPWVDPEEVWILPSDRMGPEFDRNYIRRGNGAARLVGYVYSSGTGMAPQITFGPEQIIFAKTPNPNDPIRGLSPVKGLEPTLNLMWAAMGWNKEFFDNAAALSMIVTMANAPDKESVALFRRQWQEDTGPGKRHRAKVIGGDDVKVTTFSTSPKDADFLGLLRELRQQIFAAYGTNEIVLGIVEDANLANSDPQFESVYRQGVMPRNTILTDALNASPWMQLQEPKGCYLAHDYSGVQCLQEDELQKAQTVQTLKNARVITTEEAREMIGREPMTKDEYDEIEGVPVSPFGGGDPFAEDGKDEETDPEKQAVRLSASTPATRKRRWYAHDQRMQPIERAWMRRLSGSFKSMLTSVLDDIDRRTNLGRTADESLTRLAKDDIVPPQWGNDPPEISPNEMGKMREHLLPIARSTYRYGAEDILEEINDMIVPFDITRPEVQAYIDQRLGRNVRSIVATQQERVARIVADAAGRGATMGELEKDLRTAFGIDSKTWSTRIARTESAGLYNQGALTGMKDAGVATKQWIASHDEFTRDTHAEADGQEVDIDQDFTLSSGARGPYPGQMGVAEEDINCRCGVSMGSR